MPLGGLWTATDGQAEPRLVAPASARLAREMGAHVVEGCGVTGLEVAGGRVAGVRIEAGVIRASTVIVAGGAASRTVLGTLGLDLPQQAVRGTVLRTNPVAPLRAAAIPGFGVGFRQRADGSLNVADRLAVNVDLTLGHLQALRLFAPGLVRYRRRFSLRVGRPA
jgi:glycine/D-amino acid oxidase-like deaminating enzyme